MSASATSSTEGQDHEDHTKTISRGARAARGRRGHDETRRCAAATAAEHDRDHGRRHRLVQHRRLPPGHDVGPNAEPRPARRRGHAVHRLLRRGELHGGPRQLHHRRIADPHRADDGRSGRRADRDAGRGADHRHRAQVDGLCDRPVRQEPSRRPQPILPTVHGFDEFFGYLYHLDAMEDPCHPNYPQALKDTVGPRNMVHSYATTATTRRCSRAGARSASSASRMPAKLCPSAWRPWTTRSSPRR